MQKRLYTLIVVIAATSILITGLISLALIRRTSDETNHDYLETAAAFVRASLRSNLDYERAADAMADVFRDVDLSLRVTIVAESGSVLFDNEYGSDPSNMDNHLLRPEVRQAFATKRPATAIRKSATLGVHMFYYARYDEDLGVVIRLAMPIEDYGRTTKNMVLLLVMLMIIAGGLIIGIGLRSTQKITKPLRELKDTVDNISGGDYASRAPRKRMNRLNSSSLHSFNEMATALESNHIMLYEQNRRLAATLDAMRNPLIVVNANRMVTYLNTYAQASFGRDIDPSAYAYPLILLTHNEEPERMVDEAIRREISVTREMYLSTLEGSRYFQVVCSPFEDGSGAAYVVMTFHDMTQAHQMQQMRSDFSECHA